LTDRRLDEKHRKAQLVLRAATLRDLLKLWPAFDLNRIDESWPAFEAALVLLIKARGTTSATLARSYLREYDGELPNLAKLDVDKAVAGLRVTGPMNAKKQLGNGRSIQEVEQATLVNVSGQVSRQVFNLGRATLLGGLALTARSARGSGVFSLRPGWRRVTDTDPCNWCSEDAARIHGINERFRSHSHCSCWPAPA
jgi:hypothetical protein